MNISLDKLGYGKEYSRDILADLWGYKGRQAIERGVVTPSGSKQIILFVTKEKEKTSTQYSDFIDGDFLYWEGEKGHRSDKRIINAAKSGDKIYLFFREKHHTNFVYFGEIFLKESKIYVDIPSQFIFLLNYRSNSNDVFADLEAHQNELESLEKTEKEAVIKSRIGQGVFRESLIRMWGGCSVTGLSNISLLKASHIKPWRVSTNYERLDPKNGLLLIPTLDHLFDAGYISFQDNGRIILSSFLSNSDINILNVGVEDKLRTIPQGLGKFMDFHREKIFKGKT